MTYNIYYNEHGEVSTIVITLNNGKLVSVGNDSVSVHAGARDGYTIKPTDYGISIVFPEPTPMTPTVLGAKK